MATTADSGCWRPAGRRHRATGPCNVLRNTTNRRLERETKVERNRDGQESDRKIDEMKAPRSRIEGDNRPVPGARERIRTSLPERCPPNPRRIAAVRSLDMTARTNCAARIGQRRTMRISYSVAGRATTSRSLGIGVQGRHTGSLAYAENAIFSAHRTGPTSSLSVLGKHRVFP